MKLLRKQKKTILLLALLFCVTAIASYVAVDIEAAEQMMKQFISGKGELFQATDQNFLLLLFKNNFFACFLTLVLGLLPFVFIPVWVVIINGVLIGGTLKLMSYRVGISPWRLFLLGIMPHGVFEITALILAAAMGTLLCFTVTMSIFKNIHPKKENLLSGIKIFFLLLVPLLFLSALLETYLTPYLLQHFL